MANLRILVFGILLSITTPAAISQLFDPNFDDKTYLDQLEQNVNAEVEDARDELIGQAKLIEDVTKTFVGAKLKENLFKTLRVLAENEIKEAGMLDKLKAKQPKQSEDGEGEEDSEKTGPVSSVVGGTTAGPSGLVLQVANIVKTLFGGNNRVNITSYVEAATKYLPDAVGNQLVGVAKLLAQSPASTQRRPTTLIPTTIIEITSEPEPQTTVKSGTVSTATSKPGNRTDEEIEAEEEDEDTISRQLRLPDLSGGLSILGAFLGGTAESRTTTGKPAAGAGGRRTTTESASGFEDETTSNTANLANFANDVRNGVGDLIKVVPDLFKGAREGVSLLSALRELFGSFGGGR